MKKSSFFWRNEKSFIPEYKRHFTILNNFNSIALMYRELHFKTCKKKSPSNVVSFTKPSLTDFDDSIVRTKGENSKRTFQLLSDDLFQKLDDFSGTNPFSTKRKTSYLYQVSTTFIFYERSI